MNIALLRKFLFPLFVIVFLLAVVFMWGGKKHESQPAVKSFEDCVKAGYPVMESYPRQCSLPDGRFFTETIIKETVYPTATSSK